MTHPNFFPPLLEGKIFRAFGAIMVYKDYAIFINYQHLLHQISAPQANNLRFSHSEMMISIAKSIENGVEIPKIFASGGHLERGGKVQVTLELPPPC